MDGHRWFYHQLGDPIQCNIPPCKERNFSARSALKQHVDNIHNKKFRYVCRDCPYGSDSRDYYLTHRVKQHGVKITSAKTKKPIIFTCTKCKKIFMGPSLLKRHTLRGLCTTRKRYQCRICLRMYKTQAYLDNHVEQLHREGAKTWVCSKCQKKCVTPKQHFITTSFGTEVSVFFKEPRLKQGGKGKWRLSKPPQPTCRRSCHTSRRNQGRRCLPSPGTSPGGKGKAPSTKSAPAKLVPPRRSPRQSKGRGKGKK